MEGVIRKLQQALFGASRSSPVGDNRVSQSLFRRWYDEARPDKSGRLGCARCQVRPSTCQGYDSCSFANTLANRRFNGLCCLPTGGRMRRIDILGVPWYAYTSWSSNGELTEVSRYRSELPAGVRRVSTNTRAVLMIMFPS